MVRKVIQESGLPRALIARDAELSRASLETWMAGTRTPTSESLQRLAAGLRRRAARLQELAAELERAAGEP